ncbi:MAG: Fic family protein [Nitriliruptorales bacterium]|nr:Fic family protein [Nitriliruptorales bacterium]
MTEIEYLELEDLLELVRVLGAGPVRDVGLLDAACARPQSSAFGTDAYGTLELKAAALLHSIVPNHALVDGNKRLGWLATSVFLDLNGHPPSMADDAAFELVMQVAEGRLDVEEIAERLGSD